MIGGGLAGGVISFKSSCRSSLRRYLSHQKLACSIIGHVPWQTSEQFLDEPLDRQAEFEAACLKMIGECLLPGPWYASSTEIPFRRLPGRSVWG